MLVLPPSELPLRLEGTYRLPELLARIAPGTGPASCAPGLADEVVMVWNRTETAASLRERLPNLLHARWTAGEKGVPTLVRDPAKVAQAREEGRRARMRTWLYSMTVQNARERSVYEPKEEMERYAKPPAEEEDEGVRDVPVGGVALEALGARIRLLIKPEMFAAFPLDRRTVLALRPTATQLPLPRGAEREWQTFLRDDARRRALFAQVATERNLPLERPMGFVVSFAENSLYISLVDGDGSVLETRNVWYDDGERVVKAPPNEKPAKPIPELVALNLASGIRPRPTDDPEAVRRARAVWLPRLADPVAYEPLAVEPGLRWMAASRELGRPTLAVVPDYAAYLFSPEARRPSEVAQYEWRANFLFRDDGPWTVLAPRADLPAWDARVSRLALKRAVENGGRTGRWGPDSLFPLAAPYVDSLGIDALVSRALSPAIPVFGSFGTYTLFSGGGTRFWGVLPSSIKEALLAGRPVPIGLLSGAARASLWRAVNIETEGAGREPTIAYPNGLPPDSVLTLTREGETFVQWTDLVLGSSKTFSAALLGRSVAVLSNPRLASERRGSAERLLTEPLFVGTGTEWQFKLQTRDTVELPFSTQEIQFAKTAGTRYVDLPEAFRRKVEEERVRVARLRSEEKPPAVPPPTP